jgi:hypothetical protein
MDTGATCPDCGTHGHCIGQDAKARAIFCCLQVDCDVVEYDRTVVRRRVASSAEPVHQRTHPTNAPSMRGQPFYWSRRAR